MNGDLKRQLEMERRNKSGAARSLREMRNQGAATSKSDLARHIAVAKHGLKAARNVQALLRRR